jgi:hypothetical protein
MASFQAALYIDEKTYLPWPSTLPTQELPHGPTPFIGYPARGPEAQPPKQSEGPDLPLQPKLLPRLPAGSKPIIVTCQNTSKKTAAWLKRTGVNQTARLYWKQAQILADLLGRAEATWQLGFVVLPSGSEEDPNKREGSFQGIPIQAKVLYIDFVRSQQVCFKLTADTIDALKEHYRALCRGSSEAHSSGDVTIEQDVKSSRDYFERGIEHFVHYVDTDCLEEMEKDGSGELTAEDSTNVKSAILELFGPHERYVNIFPELPSSRLDGAFSKASTFEFQHQQSSSHDRSFDAQASADTITFRQPTRS